MKTKNKNIEGFAMIEVLLAVVVLAIGLLAGSRMQMLGLSYSAGATTRTNATMAANDIIDRMRLNSEGVIAGDYDNADTDALLGNPNCIQTIAGCTSAQLAQTDLFLWGRFFGQSDAIDGILPPTARGTIEEDSGVRTITITWSDLINGELEDNKFIQISMQTR